MTQIIAFCGRAQSGKTSSCNFVAGTYMRRADIISGFDIDEAGNLVVPTLNADGQSGWGILDLNNKSEDFFNFASHRIWPTVKLYNIADSLKSTLIDIFGIKYESLYGTNEQKNELTHIEWSAFAPFTKTKKKLPEGKMTGRELMQVFGTDIVRKIYADAWVSSCLRQIAIEQPEYALIADVRFENELDAISVAGGSVYKLTANPLDNQHESELSVDAIPLEKFRAIIDNAGTSIYEKNELIRAQLVKDGLL